MTGATIAPPDRALLCSLTAGGVLAVVGALIASSALLSSPGEQPEPASATLAAPHDAPLPRATPVLVDFRGRGAEVWIDGSPFGPLPLRVQLARGVARNVAVRSGAELVWQQTVQPSRGMTFDVAWPHEPARARPPITQRVDRHHRRPARQRHARH